jgi:RNA polymerase sigma-70 factor (ECF subfamily)
MEQELNSNRLPSTHWSEIASASHNRQQKGREAMEHLLTRYQPALLAHLRFKFRVVEDAARDLLQSFVADKILEKEMLAQANPTRGRFRTFLLNALDNFVISQRRKEQAQKRSPGGDVLSVDELSPADEPQHNDSPTDPTVTAWAQAAINAALQNMRRECETSKRTDVWGVFEGRVLSAILEDMPETGYEALIERFGFGSPSQAFNTLSTAKRMFKRHLSAVIAEYSRDDREVEEELRELKERLLRAG